MLERVPERLQVFVSSTIQECAAERAIAKRAIESLNHQPILFEHVGARSSSPRQMYLGKLDQSDIFVAIYKNSYGWVAPGATISGIDDELRRSAQRGMTRLVYVLQSEQDRDARLKTMLEGLQDVTYWRFRNPEDLYGRIRDDVEAEVTRRFQNAERLEAIVRADPADAISGLVPAPGHLLRRGRLAEDLLHQLSTQNVLQVSGELGIGKTVFLASVAAESGFLFVSGTQLSKHELACVLANKLASVSGGQPRYFLDASTAYSALIESWRAAGSFTLVIDDCPDPEFVAALLKNVGGGSGTKRLIYSMRNADASYGHMGFPIPPLSLVEVGELLSNYGQRLSGKELDEIHHRSGGNPLYLLYFSQSTDTNTEKSLLEYELDAWRKLTPVARELVSYLEIAS